MIKLKLIFIFCHNMLIVGILFSQTTYYVSSSDGSDSNSGTNPDQSWHSLSKINEFKANPGDQILFKCGDEWEGTLTIPVSGESGNPIIYGAYGEGNKPMIYGSVEVSGWTKFSQNIYRTLVDQPDIKQLFLDGTRMKLARYPNQGYFTITSVASKTEFSSKDLDGNVEYSQAVAIMRVNEYRLYARDIKNSDGQNITLVTAPMAKMDSGYGFWLTNKLDFLDEAGEWYYDSHSKMLYLWTPAGDTPDNYVVRVSTIDHGIFIGDKSFITIRDLELLHFGESGIRITGGDFNRIENLSINYPELAGIEISNSGTHDSRSNVGTYNLINNCCVYGSNGRGLSSFGNNTTFTNNVIEKTGQQLSINKITYEHDGNNGTAIYSRNNNHIIEYNRLIDSGHNGINFQGVNTRVRFNYINGVCQVLGDGGGIYCYKGRSFNDDTKTVGSIIENNLIFNAFGNPDGAIKGYGDAFGIYLDDNSKGVTVRNNTVNGSTAGAMFIKGGNNLVEYNLFMNSILLLRANPNVADVTVKNNIFYQTDRKGTFTWSRSVSTHQRMIQPLSGSNFVYDYNSYVAHYNTEDLFMGGYVDFEDWKNKTGQDFHSTFDGSTLNEGEGEQLFYNETKEKKTFEFGNATYRNLDGLVVEGPLILEPFESVILIRIER